MIQEAVLAINAAEAQDINVYWQDEVEINLDIELLYIKSGQKEIQDYVDNVAKPEIEQYVEDEARPIVSEVVSDIAQPIIDIYMEENVKPAIDDYADEKMAEYAQTATDAAGAASASAAAALVSQTEAEKSANDAKDTEERAKGEIRQIVVDGTDAFNTNAAEKQAAVDASALAAASSAAAALASEQGAQSSANNAKISEDEAKATVDGAIDGINTTKTEAISEIDAHVADINDMIANYSPITFSLFDVKFSDHLLNNISWLRADTFSWQSGTVYTAAYNELLAEYDNEASIEETEENITFKRTPKGYKIAAADQETAVLELFETTGVAWYYVLDTAGQRFKLPRTKYGFAGVRNNAGDYVPESLPNITGKLGATGNQMVIGLENNKDVGTSGVFSTRNRIVYGGFGNGNGYAHRCEIDFSAADCSSVYQDNAPVQERATEMYLYFYVGNYEQSAIEQTAGLNAELFNGKLDIGLENISSSGKKRVVRWGMPDYSAGIDVTSEFSAQTWWTATKSGWYVIAAGAESYFDIRANETETQRTIVAGAGPTPYILSSGVFVAEAGQRLYCHRKSGSYPVAMYYPFKGAN